MDKALEKTEDLSAIFLPLLCMLKNYAVCYIVLQESILCLYGGYLQVCRGPFLNKRNTEQDLDNDYGVSVVSLFYYCPMLQLLQGIYIVSAGYPECVGCL